MKSQKPDRVNRLFFDIETSPNVGMFWRAGYKLSIQPDNIIKERAIICICYKWEHEKTVQFVQWDKDQCDKKALTEFIEVANQADELVGHNGDRFDLPWIKTRCLFHGIPTFPSYKTIDTLAWARRKFYFNSNRLDYLGKFLGVGGKIKTTFDLWKKILLDNNQASLREMVTYCKRDVLMLQEVYLKLASVMPHKTHAGVLNGKDKWESPFGGGTNVHVNKKRVTAAGTVQYAMQCQQTGRYYQINEAQYGKYLEWRAEQKDKKA